MPELEPHEQLRANSVGLLGVLMQGVATMAPAFAILSTFVFTVGLAGLAAPLAYLLGGLVLIPLALSVNELARVFPSAGGWFTWIGRSLHPRAGFFAGWYFSLWLPLAPTLIFAYMASTVLTPCVAAEYGVHVPVWLWTVAGVGGVAWTAYRGVQLSERVLLITGTSEIAIMAALALSGLLSPGRGGFNFAPFNAENVPVGGSLFLAVVFSIFAYSGWEAVAPLAEESRDPKRNVPRALLGSVLAMIVFLVFTVWGYLIGIGTDDVGQIKSASAFPVFALAKRVWGGFWVLGPLAMLNSALAATAACFNGGTRTWYGMARAGLAAGAGQGASGAQDARQRHSPDARLSAGERRLGARHQARARFAGVGVHAHVWVDHHVRAGLPWRHQALRDRGARSAQRASARGVAQLGGHFHAVFRLQSGSAAARSGFARRRVFLPGLQRARRSRALVSQADRSRRLARASRTERRT